MKTSFSMPGRLAVAALFAATAWLFGCVGDDADAGGGASRTQGNGLTLKIRTPQMPVATRGATNENAVRTLDVIVFDESGGFVEYLPAKILGTEFGDRITQAFVPMREHPSSFSLSLVANYPDPAGLAALIAGEPTKSDFLGDLRIEDLDGSTTNLIWNGTDGTKPMPMYGETPVMGSIPGTAIVVDLIRSLARIDLSLDDALVEENFTMMEVAFLNFCDEGVLAGRETTDITDWRYNPITVFDVRGDNGAGPPVPFTSTAGQVYIFEQQAADNADPDMWAGSPHMVVRIRFAGEDENSTPHYYRINLVSDGQVEGYPKGQYVPVLRNHRYVITIKQLMNAGFATAEEASASSGGLENIDYDMLLFPEEITHAVFDGRNYMVFSHEEILLPVGGGLPPDGPYIFDSLWVFSNHPDHRATLTIDDDDPWISLYRYEVSALGENRYNFEYEWIDERSVSVYAADPLEFLGFFIGAKTPNPSPNTPRVGHVTITDGKLTGTVNVVQQPSGLTLKIADSQGDRDVFGDNAKDIVFYTWQGNNFIGDSYAQIFAEWKSPNGRLDISNQGGGPGVSPFVFSSADGCFDFNTSISWPVPGDPATASPRIVKVAPFVSGTTNRVQQTKLFFSQTVDVGPGGMGFSRLEARNFIRKDYFVTPDDEYVFCDGTQQSISLRANTDFTVSHVDGFYPWLPNIPDATFTAPSAGYYDTPLGMEGQFTRNLTFTLPAISNSQWSLAEPYAELTFKITAYPCNDPMYEGVAVEDYFTVLVVPAEPSANSYIVKPNSLIAIPVARAEDAMASQNITAWLGGTSNPAALTAQLLWLDDVGVLTSARTVGRGRKGYVLLETGSVEGNGVVVLRTDHGTPAAKTRWSWHIWVTPDRDVIEEGYGPTNKWMDRNLGATYSDTELPGLTALSDWVDYNTGMLYQWGRKDATPRVNRFYDPNTGNWVNMTYNTPGYVFMEWDYMSLQQMIESPLLIGTYTSSNRWEGSVGIGSWYDGGGKTWFDPCPPGWRVPRQSEYPSPGVYPVVIAQSAGAYLGSVRVDFGSQSELPTLSMEPSMIRIDLLEISPYFLVSDPAPFLSSAVQCYYANASRGVAQMTTNMRLSNQYNSSNGGIPWGHRARMRCIRE